MTYDVFDAGYSPPDPRNPGRYLGSVEIPNSREGVPNRAALRFLDHLDRTRRNAYSTRFKLVPQSERKIYKNFFV